MAKNAFPDGPQLAIWLLNKGHVDELPDPDEMEDYAIGAASQFVAACGWPSFLAVADAEQTYPAPRYTALGYRVDVGAWREISAVTSGGRALVGGSDYRVIRLREGADEDERPNPIVGLALRSSCEVTIAGVRGYAAKVPSGAWLAVMRRAAKGVLVEDPDASAIVKKIKQGPVEIERQSEAGRDVLTRWDADFMAQTALHERV